MCAGTHERLALILHDLLAIWTRPGDRSYATLEGSISTAVKLSQVTHDKQTCGGVGDDEVFSKAMPVSYWCVIITAMCIPHFLLSVS